MAPPRKWLIGSGRMGDLSQKLLQISIRLEYSKPVRKLCRTWRAQEFASERGFNEPSPVLNPDLFYQFISSYI